MALNLTLDSEREMLEIRMLGQFSVRLDDQPVVIKNRPAQSLLAYLVLNAGRAHRREKLAGIFWPDATETNARSNLRHALWRIRKALGEKKNGQNSFLEADNFTITYASGEDQWVDAYHLQERSSNDPSLDDLIEDVSVYGGELLPGFYDDWVILERERLRAVLDDKMQLLLDRSIVEERWRDAMEWGERWIALGHVPEPAYRAIMIAQHGLGDMAGVAATYLRCQLALEEEVGVEPSELTKATYLWLTENGPRPVDLPIQVGQKPVSSSAIAADSLLSQWRAQGKDVLDVASLAMIHSAGSGLNIKDEDAPLLIRSALQVDIDVDPWVDRLSSPAVAVAALNESYNSNANDRLRRRVVDALTRLPGPESDESLLTIAFTDEIPEVRETAAVAAAKRGHSQDVACKLAEELNRGASPAALTAFVAVADEVGLPDDIGPYPKLMVDLTLAQRRWRNKQQAIRSQAFWAALWGGVGSALMGSLVPVQVAIAQPEAFRENLDIFTLAAWVFSGLLVGLVYGVGLGAALGFSVGIADALSSSQSRSRWRILAGALAGLVFSITYIAFALMRYFQPEVGPQTYIPVALLTGLLLGTGISFVIPELGTIISPRSQLRRIAFTTIFIAAAFLIFDWLVYPSINVMAFLNDLITYTVFALALALGLSDLNGKIYRI